MIRERNRHEPAACQPAIDVTEEQDIAQRLTRSGIGKDNRFVAVCPAQRFQPFRSVKDGRPDATFRQVDPATIHERIDLAERQRLSREPSVSAVAVMARSSRRRSKNTTGASMPSAIRKNTIPPSWCS